MKRKCLTVLLIAITLIPFMAMAQEKPSGKILFIDSPSIDKNYLATIMPDGTGKTRLTPAFNNIMFPKFNEKSGWIGFTNKTPEMKSEIYLLNKNGDKIKRVLTGAAFEDFSPDGKFFLYTTCDGKAELYVYSLDRKRANKISQNLKVVSANWSADGEWIAASVLEKDGSTDLYLISTMAQGIKRLTATEKVNEAFPVFSKDGKFLVYFTNRYGKNELEYMDLADKKLQRPIISGIYPSLSPANKWVTFQAGNTIGISRIDGVDNVVLTKGRTPCWIK
ncbi:MAG: TolB protein [Clostridiales bacterium]|jgi:Tol biopolymer transport system component|nr:TolB protein [Clostridiales bacterium]MDN5281484.1 TolB protein [Candidatus Ozemobacter sp.]